MEMNNTSTRSTGSTGESETQSGRTKGWVTCPSVRHPKIQNHRKAWPPTTLVTPIVSISGVKIIS
jgi:hypothetical protein